MFSIRLAYGLLVSLSLVASAASAQWTTNGANIVWTQDNVGIGTNNPVTDLHVVTDQSGGPFLASGMRVENLNPAAVGERTVVLSLKNNHSSSPQDWLLSVIGNSAGRSGNFEIRQIGAGASNVNRLTITPNGNVGVGTTTPLARLHVAGSIRGNGTAGALRVKTDAGWLDLGPKNATWAHLSTDRAHFLFNKQVRVQGGVLSSATSGGNPNGNLLLATRGATRIFARHNDGFVGIGTTNPQSLLAVNGKITAREVQVTGNGWADYVFDDGYELMPLEEVAEHIEALGHLPGIPSEDEVMEQGVDLGAMQVKLLAKIEELTLHMIDLKQQNETLADRNLRLATRLEALEEVR